MAVPKKKKSYTKCNQRYTAWRNNKNCLSPFNFCNVCLSFNFIKPALYVKTNKACFKCLKIASSFHTKNNK